MLRDLQHPEADSERRERHDGRDLKADEPRANASAIFCYRHRRSVKESAIGDRESVIS
jgi:hypothetical protein